MRLVMSRGCARHQRWGGAVLFRQRFAENTPPFAVQPRSSATFTAICSSRRLPRYFAAVTRDFADISDQSYRADGKEVVIASSLRCWRFVVRRRRDPRRRNSHVTPVISSSCHRLTRSGANAGRQTRLIRLTARDTYASNTFDVATAECRFALPGRDTPGHAGFRPLPPRFAASFAQSVYTLLLTMPRLSATRYEQLAPVLPEMPPTAQGRRGRRRHSSSAPRIERSAGQAGLSQDAGTFISRKVS